METPTTTQPVSFTDSNYVSISRTQPDGTTVNVNGLARDIDLILETFNKAIANKGA